MAQAMHRPAIRLETCKTSPALPTLQKPLQTLQKRWRQLVAGVLLGVLSTAHAEERPQPIPMPAAAPAVGTLVLAGGGELPKEARDHIVQLAGGKNARLVIVTTASETADYSEPMDISYYLWKGWEGSVASAQLLHTRDREVANNPDFSKPLENATFVWLAGGKQLPLAKAYRGTLVEQRFREVLGRGGVVAGTSAGAAAACPNMIAHGKVVDKGLNLLHPNFTVDQHFVKRERYDRLKAVLDVLGPEQTGLGIDEGTVLFIRGSIGTVMGGTVWICKAQNEPHILNSGETIDLRLHGMTPVPVETP